MPRDRSIRAPMIYILYSDDYEVFLGGNYRPETEVLVRTTDRLLSACEAIGVSMTLFCDVACLWRYRELGHTDFVSAVENQLRHAVERGHDVQAHLHPHWIDTEIEHDGEGASRYRFDMDRFLLGNIDGQGNPAKRRSITDLLAHARSYLEDLLRPIDPAYVCTAFRAGGYGIQPGTEEIFTALLDAGYRIDSSVVPGMVLQSNVNRIDFTTVPERGNYCISPELGLSRAAGDGIFEIPVAAGRVGSRALARADTRRVVRRLKRLPRPVSLGYSIQMTAKRNAPPGLLALARERARTIRAGWGMLELCHDAALMADITRSYVDRCGTGAGDLYFSFSCHSKSIDPAALAAMREYHRRLEGFYGSKLKAITFREAAHHLETGAGARVPPGAEE
ncbi:hypothetical protein ACFL4G_02110 [Thermodesulfobacteriota bacterium]